MRIVSPELWFKGDRHYVHGTSIYHTIIDEAEKLGLGKVDGRVTVSIRRTTINQIDFHYVLPEDDYQIPLHPAVEFQIECGGRNISGWVEESDRRILIRKPHDEKLIEQMTHVDGDEIGIHGNPPFSVFEIAASMTKELHYNLFPPAVGKKWLLAKVELNRPLALSDLDGFHLKIIKNLGGVFTVTAVLNKMESIGLIFFSQGEDR